MSALPRRRGRPPIGPEIRGLRLAADTVTDLEGLAVAWGVPRAEVIRSLVEVALSDPGVRSLTGAVVAVRVAARR